jgi:hypothetical protein
VFHHTANLLYGAENAIKEVNKRPVKFDGPFVMKDWNTLLLKEHLDTEEPDLTFGVLLTFMWVE